VKVLIHQVFISNTQGCYTVNNFYEIPGFVLKTFLGPGMGKLFPARESLVSDIPAGDGNTAKPFFTV
jgi:hypothetical protein